MVNKFKILAIMLFAVSLGMIIHNLIAMPKSYAAPQSLNNFKQILLQSKDKNVAVFRTKFDESMTDSVVQRKLSDVGDDFIVILQPNLSFTDNFPAHYIPFSSILRVEKYKDGNLVIWIR